MLRGFCRCVYGPNYEEVNANTSYNATNTNTASNSKMLLRMAAELELTGGYLNIAIKCRRMGSLMLIFLVGGGTHFVTGMIVYNNNVNRRSVNNNDTSDELHVHNNVKGLV